MSHFYGNAQGNRSEASRGGSKDSGFITEAASWSGSIRVDLTHNRETGEDSFTVTQQPWQGSGISELLAEGIIGKPTKEVQE